MSDGGFVCRQCGGRDFEVVRTIKLSDAVQRIRECRRCGRRVGTKETVVTLYAGQRDRRSDAKG